MKAERSFCGTSRNSSLVVCAQRPGCWFRSFVAFCFVHKATFLGIILENMLHIGRNIISLVISRVLAAVILFLIYTRLAQYLGPEAAGQYGLLASYITIFSIFVDLGRHSLFC